MRRRSFPIALLLLQLAFPRAEAVGSESAPADTTEREGDGSVAMSQSLALVDVLTSVQRHYPLLEAVIEERAIAEAGVLAKQGAFDLRLGAKGKLKPEGYYETYEGGVSLEQPTTLWGLELFSGYRVGSGDFAIWDGGDQTNKGGELRLGLRLPLLRNRAIDDRRGALQKAQIEYDAAEPTIREKLIAFERAAAFAYWEWVATGKGVDLARQLFDIAAQRQAQLARRVDRGALPAIDLADNERLIVDRQLRLISAERELEQATLDLSLFLRDPDGNPTAAPPSRVPETFPGETPPDVDALASEIERAYAQQPILRAIEFALQKLEVDVALAENRLLPKVGVTIGGSQDLGAASKVPDDKGPAVLEARIEFDLSVQRRQARGEVLAAQARVRQVLSQQRFARDRIAVEVKNSMGALRAAYEKVSVARQNLELAQRLRKAEERKLSLGTSNLINVNIREIQAFDAASTLIATQADYFRAEATYRAALGDDLTDSVVMSTPVSRRRDG